MKWETECLNNWEPLPTLQCAGYSVKLIYDYFVQKRQRRRPKVINCLIFFVTLSYYLVNVQLLLVHNL